jgi:hypothetical protein
MPAKPHCTRFAGRQQLEHLARNIAGTVGRRQGSRRPTVDYAVGAPANRFFLMMA